MWSFVLSILRAIPFLGSFFKEDFGSLYSVEEKPLKTTRKVAIIGNGVGGSSAAYFLHELLGSSVEVHVFGDGKVGGRTGVVEFVGNKYEAGASIIHKKNRYMMGLAAKFGLKKAESPDEYLGIFDGVQFLYRSSAFSLISTLKMLWRYGFGLRKLQSYLNKLLGQFSSIYDMQHKGQSFSDPVAMVKAMGSHDIFYHLTQVSAEEYFSKELGWGDRIVNEIVSGVCRNNYCQDITDITGMVGSVSIAGAQDGSLYAIVGGNFQVPVKALETSAAEVHNVHVTKVSRVVTPDKKSPSFVLNYTEDEAVGQSEYWDAVIVACPLETSDIQFEGFDTDNWTSIKKQAFHRTVANFIYGKLNPRFFGASTRDRTFPQTILTTKMQHPAVNFTTIGLNYPADYTEQQKTEHSKAVAAKDTANIYKIFSSEPLTEDQLNLIFSEYTEHTAVDWMAYPEYVVPEYCGTFILNEGLFYINCIERVSSAMEMSCIGAKNVSLLATDYLHKLD